MAGVSYCCMMIFDLETDRMTDYSTITTELWSKSHCPGVKMSALTKWRYAVEASQIPDLSSQAQSGGAMRACVVALGGILLVSVR
mmetsp:Transcript_69003/g.183871  ORF Transcript_69003/g.183871 Transcript_69003/m.183871 type:complete len:85 (+) Transcript_69003:93-347(+)